MKQVITKKALRSIARLFCEDDTANSKPEEQKISARKARFLIRACLKVAYMVPIFKNEKTRVFFKQHLQACNELMANCALDSVAEVDLLKAVIEVETMATLVSNFKQAETVFLLLAKLNKNNVPAGYKSTKRTAFISLFSHCSHHEKIAMLQDFVEKKNDKYQHLSAYIIPEDIKNGIWAKFSCIGLHIGEVRVKALELLKFSRGKKHDQGLILVRKYLNMYLKDPGNLHYNSEVAIAEDLSKAAFVVEVTEN